MKKSWKNSKENYLPLQPGDMIITSSDVTDLEKDVRYKPLTKIEEGVHQFIQWYLDYAVE